MLAIRLLVSWSSARSWETSWWAWCRSPSMREASALLSSIMLRNFAWASTSSLRMSAMEDCSASCSWRPQPPAGAPHNASWPHSLLPGPRSGGSRGGVGWGLGGGGCGGCLCPLSSEPNT
uniref:Putative secreted protein n=1 Tax=Ixodes ricinus TaxID=34613 RepID=A0A6B0UNP2_IXORI